MSAHRPFLEAVPSIFWTVALLGPVYLFCANHLLPGRIIAFVAAGLLSMLLPEAALARLALSVERTVYERWHVDFLIRITQNAGWLRRLAGNSKPRARRDAEAMRIIVHDTWIRERFHLGLFTFCILCSIVAVLQRQWLWLLALTLINLFYNLYPMWLQQYLRLRIGNCQRRLLR